MLFDYSLKGGGRAPSIPDHFSMYKHHLFRVDSFLSCFHQAEVDTTRNSLCVPLDFIRASLFYFVDKLLYPSAQKIIDLDRDMATRSHNVSDSCAWVERIRKIL